MHKSPVVWLGIYIFCHCGCKLQKLQKQNQYVQRTQRCKGAKVQKVQKDFHIDKITKLQNCKWKNQIGLLGERPKEIKKCIIYFFIYKYIILYIIL